MANFVTSVMSAVENSSTLLTTRDLGLTTKHSLGLLTTETVL